MHPVATSRRNSSHDTDMSAANIEAATRLEVPFKISDSEPARFRVEVARRIAACNEHAGLPGDWLIPPGERAGSDRDGAGVARLRAWPTTSRCPGDGRRLPSIQGHRGRRSPATI